MPGEQDNAFFLALGGLAALFLVNRLSMRSLARHPKALGGLLAANVGIAVYVAFFGLPGLPHGGARWLIVAALAIHVVLGISEWDRHRKPAP